MVDHGGQPAPVQQSLFPEAFEVEAQSLSALRDLDVGRARMLLDRARSRNPRLVNLGVLEQALCLLESLLPCQPVRGDQLAAVVLAVRHRFLAGKLPLAAAEFVDQTIARYWRRRGSPGPFLDEGARVHRGVLDLVLQDAAAARRHLRQSLDGDGHGGRADLWGYLGDACLALEREEEANACYVRALVVAVADVDLLRTRHRGLVRLYEELSATAPEGCARELLLIEGWLSGVLDIPAGSGWLDGRLAQLQVRSQAGPASSREDRYRRFGLLLFLDRSQPGGRVDVARREEMAALEGELFGRYMDACREREHAAGG